MIAKYFRWVLHPISIFVIAHISWALLMAVWIHWYIIRNKELDIIVGRIPIPPQLRTGDWIILAEGCLLMGIILVGLYLIFVSLGRQVRLNRLQDTILNNITHELKTPLASIKLYTETQLIRDLTLEKRREFLEKTLKESERLQKLIDCVLISARDGVGQRAHQFQTLDVLDIIKKSWTTLGERYGQTRHFAGVWQLPQPNTLCLMSGNPLDLMLLFDNIFENSVKYTHENGKISLNVSLDPKGLLKVTLEDNGIGIDPKHLKHIFKKFYRAEQNLRHRIQGTGLGLYVCKSIVKDHGGTIEAKSLGQGQGTTVHISFKTTLSFG